MRTSKVSLIAFSLIALASLLPSRVESFKVDLDRLDACVDQGIQALTSLALKAVPSVKSIAACSNFNPMKTRGLDLTELGLLTYQYLQKIVGNQRCLLNTIKELYDHINPYLNRIMRLRCVASV
ncbi:accessory gland protein Acp53Ea [Drosophila ficusphila]|uniref:accessory gland protein Acp53Ea n=1 Tax=Drosophila ficusphila TaxID=30025 RepID=UPI0007E75B35|nr:accessory gland protein Acp53Ea [Drosophila ficusphila]